MRRMKIEWRTCFRIGLSIFLLFLLIHYWTLLSGMLGLLIKALKPLLLGCVLAYIVNILMSFYEKFCFPASKQRLVCKTRRPLCIVAAFATLILVLGLLIRLVVPQLTASVELLAAQIPGALESFFAWMEGMQIVPRDLLAPLNNIDWKARTEQIVGMVSTGVSSVMGTAVSVVSSIVSGVVTSLFALIFSIYLLMGKEALSKQIRRIFRRYIREPFYENSWYVLSVVNESFHKYIVGQCTEAAILGGLCSLGMLLLRIPYAAMTGAVIAFTALIPVAGGYIGAGLGAFMILTVSPMKALVFLLYIVILQQLEGNLIYPRVVGSSMGLPAIWVLAAVTVGGGVLGIAGMLIGVPLAAALYRLLREDVRRVRL